MIEIATHVSAEPRAAQLHLGNALYRVLAPAHFIKSLSARFSQLSLDRGSCRLKDMDKRHPLRPLATQKKLLVVALVQTALIG